MSAEGYRYKGVARNGKIELEPGVVVPEGAEVIVLFEPAAEPKSARDAALEHLKKVWKEGLNLRGGPCFNREDMYEETGRPN